MQKNEAVFLARIGTLELKLTARKLHKPCHKAIVAAALGVYNEKQQTRDAVARVLLDGIEVNDTGVSISSLLGDSGADLAGEAHTVDLLLESEEREKAQGEAALPDPPRSRVIAVPHAASICRAPEDHRL